MDWSSDGSLIVVGDVLGIIYLVDVDRLVVLDQAKTKYSSEEQVKEK